MDFEFATASRILFGPGRLKEIGPLSAGMGSRCFVLTGKKPDRAKSLLDQLGHHRLPFVLFSVPTEPTVSLAVQAVACARQAQCDLVIAMGGGSVIDMGKAVAALLTNPGDLLAYLEVIGQGHPIQQPPVPMIAIPTTAGTGAEVTRNAVLSVPEHQRKVSMRHAMMLPTLALVDPELSYSMPPELTASTGLDALTQLVEPFVSSQANPITDSMCRAGLRRVARSLRRVHSDGQNREAREDMAMASLLGGLALANAKLGAVHGFAGPLGGEFCAAHGAICGRLLPFVVEANVKALVRRDPKSPRLRRFNELGPLLTGNAQAQAGAAVDWIHGLCEDLSTLPLRDIGLHRDHFSAIVEKAKNSSSMKGNPIALTCEELTSILERAL
jgi:alcohol dehydrogenase class IV